MLESGSLASLSHPTNILDMACQLVAVTLIFFIATGSVASAANAPTASTAALTTAPVTSPNKEDSATPTVTPMSSPSKASTAPSPSTSITNSKAPVTPTNAATATPPPSDSTSTNFGDGPVSEPESQGLEGPAQGPAADESGATKMTSAAAMAVAVAGIFAF